MIQARIRDPALPKITFLLTSLRYFFDVCDIGKELYDSFIITPDFFLALYLNVFSCIPLSSLINQITSVRRGDRYHR